MLARIYQPSRNAMQSGDAKSDTWVLEYTPEESRKVNPGMGTTFPMIVRRPGHTEAL